MAPTLKRGLLRLAVVLMIGWNLFVFWFLYKSHSEQLSWEMSRASQAESDCVKSRSYADCSAEWKRSVGDYSPWAETMKEFTPSAVAIIELFPPVTITILWGVLWILTATFAWLLRGFGIELKRQRDSGQSVTMVDRMRGVGQWVIAPKNILALSVAIVALTVSHYCLVSLPASNRARLQFEKDTAATAKAERDSKEEALTQASQERDLSFQNCSSEAESSYWSYVKLNGREIPGKPGTYTAPMYVWNAANKQKADALAECHRQSDPR